MARHSRLDRGSFLRILKFLIYMRTTTHTFCTSFLCRKQAVVSDLLFYLYYRICHTQGNFPPYFSNMLSIVSLSESEMLKYLPVLQSFIVQQESQAGQNIRSAILNDMLTSKPHEGSSAYSIFPSTILRSNSDSSFVKVEDTETSPY